MSSNAIHSKAEGFLSFSQKLDDDMQKLALKIKHHEDNVKTLKIKINELDESIYEKQVALGKYHSSASSEELNSVSNQESEQQTVKCILNLETTAASIICSLKLQPSLSIQSFPSKDVIGVVAQLGKVDDDNLSRLLAEFLGLETMLAIVCRNFQSVKALEDYGEDDDINRNAGLHGIGYSVGRIMDGRFLVISLENIRSYPGKFVSNDQQRRLDLLNPKLSGGVIPPGFLGFAVNMIYVDPMHLSCITHHGKGLRETLFYSLFSHLQVYRTRSEMLRAIPCISDGAISLDGGIIKKSGIFSLGFREEVAVRFPLSCGIPKQPHNIVQIEEELKLLRWKRERLSEDVKREETLKKSVKSSFEKRKPEANKLQDESMQCVIKVLTNLPIDLV
ncbi:defective in meristem silencing 3 [Wolffia australiana]